MKRLIIVLFTSFLFLSGQGCHETHQGDDYQLESISFTEDMYILLPKTSTSLKLNIKYKGKEEFQLTGPALEKLNLKWELKDEKVAKVSNQGLLEGLADGSTTLTITSTNGLESSAQVIVGTEGLEIEGLTFVPVSYYVEKGESSIISLDVKYKGIDVVKNISGKALNDLTDIVKLEVEDPSIAKIVDGSIIGIIEGETAIKAESGALKAKASIFVNKGYSLSALSKQLEASMIFSKNIRLKNNSIMQCFDIDANNNIYYCQIAGGNAFMLNLQKGAPNESANNSWMQVKYFGHGTNVAYESENGNDYIWVGSYGSLRTSDNSYRYSQTVARVKFENGKVINPEDCEEHYYIPGQHNLHPAIDIENDLLAISTHDGTQRYYIYSLSEAKKLPVEEVKLAKERTWGGTSGDDNPQVKEFTMAKVRNLSKLKPISEFALPINATSGNDFGFYAGQGFDVHKDMLFYYEGEHNNFESSKPSNAYVTVIDFKGNVVFSRTRVALTDNLSILQANSISQIGCLEAEGIKYHNGKLYLGFAARNSNLSTDTRFNDIFVFDFLK